MAYRIDREKCVGCGACLRLCPVQIIAGEKKKPHVIAERDCIECGTCGRICPHGAVLDATGRTAVFVKRPEWPRPRIELKTCIACSSCVSACPVGCLVLSDAPREGGMDAYPYLKDEKACIACEFCRKECPVDAIRMEMRSEAKK